MHSYIEGMSREQLQELYNNEQYPGMTYGDVRRIDIKNTNNHYGISYGEIIRLAKQHRVARKKNDLRTMSKIEYRLTDINFHYECGLMSSGEYDKLIKECEVKL